MKELKKYFCVHLYIQTLSNCHASFARLQAMMSLEEKTISRWIQITQCKLSLIKSLLTACGNITLVEIAPFVRLRRREKPGCLILFQVRKTVRGEMGRATNNFELNCSGIRLQIDYRQICHFPYDPRLFLHLQNF